MDTDAARQPTLSTACVTRHSCRPSLEHTERAALSLPLRTHDQWSTRLGSRQRGRACVGSELPKSAAVAGTVSMNLGWGLRVSRFTEKFESVNRTGPSGNSTKLFDLDLDLDLATASGTSTRKTEDGCGQAASGSAANRRVRPRQLCLGSVVQLALPSIPGGSLVGIARTDTPGLVESKDRTILRSDRSRLSLPPSVSLSLGLCLSLSLSLSVCVCPFVLGRSRDVPAVGWRGAVQVLLGEQHVHRPIGGDSSLDGGHCRYLAPNLDRSRLRRHPDRDRVVL
jgi:hypothetical protein